MKMSVFSVFRWKYSVFFCILDEWVSVFFLHFIWMPLDSLLYGLAQIGYINYYFSIGQLSYCHISIVIFYCYFLLSFLYVEIWTVWLRNFFIYYLIWLSSNMILKHIFNNSIVLQPFLLFHFAFLLCSITLEIWVCLSVVITLIFTFSFSILVNVRRKPPLSIAVNCCMHIVKSNNLSSDNKGIYPIFSVKPRRFTPTITS